MKRSTSTVRIIFWLYLVILTWGILFKFATQAYQIPIFFMNYRYINWLPFAQPLVVDGRLVWEEMVFNLLAFLPFGFLLPMLKPSWSMLTILSAGFMLSLGYEVLQYLLAIGMADVTDVLLNTAGIGLGILAHRLVCKEKKWR